MQEIFDVRTLAGQVVNERLANAQLEQERCPVEPESSKDPLQEEVDVLAAVVSSAFPNTRRVLVLGRLGRVLARSLEKVDSQ
ncbi:unnamed protein product, partial [Effrenium voratum]